MKPETRRGLPYVGASALTATNLQPRKQSVSNFKTWTQENLAQFAEEANARMIEQHEYAEQLQRDLKDAIEAYRELIRRSAPSK